MKKLINSFTAVLFIITTFIIAGCSENSPVQTGANLESAQHLKQVYKDGTAQSLMQDLRNNLNKIQQYHTKTAPGERMVTVEQPFIIMGR